MYWLSMTKAETEEMWAAEAAATEQKAAEAAMVALNETRWVHCELCGGSGEVELAPIVGPYEDPTPDGELCSACGGTGRDCVEVQPIECDDDPSN